MNWFKNKTFRILFFIGAALIIGAIPLTFSFPASGKLGLFMTIAGGGVLGIAISLRLQSRAKDKKPHENNLKRKAWKEFLSLIGFSVFGFFIYGLLTYTDVKGMPMLIGMGVMLVSMVIGGFVVKRQKGETVTPEFDERELTLLQRAASIGATCFMLYAVIIMMVMFSLIGGRGMVPMWSIPVALFVGLLFAGTVQFLILMHHIKDDGKTIIGEAV